MRAVLTIILGILAFLPFSLPTDAAMRLPAPGEGAVVRATPTPPATPVGGIQQAIIPQPGTGTQQPGVTPPPGSTPAPPAPGTGGGDAESLYQTGETYYYGNGVQQSYSEAVNWYLRAIAVEEHAEALFSLGYMYSQGQGVPQDYGQALQYYRRAAEQDHPAAMGNLGWLYWNGYGVEASYPEAAYWHRRAADLGNTSSMVNLAILLDEGRGVAADYDSAASYLVRAYVLGDDSAYNWLFNQSDQWHVNTRIEVQRLLRNAGVYSGALDGALGPASRSALEAYRARQGV